MGISSYEGTRGICESTRIGSLATTVRIPSKFRVLEPGTEFQVSTQ